MSYGDSEILANTVVTFGGASGPIDTLVDIGTGHKIPSSLETGIELETVLTHALVSGGQVGTLGSGVIARLRRGRVALVRKGRALVSIATLLHTPYLRHSIIP